VPRRSEKITRPYSPVAISKTIPTSLIIQGFQSDTNFGI
jgi:hypothetical protein